VEQLCRLGYEAARDELDRKACLDT